MSKRFGAAASREEWIKRERVRDHWEEHGPRLLEALRLMKADFKPCSKPVGAPHSDARTFWEGQVKSYVNAIEAIAAAEKVPGDD